MGRPNEVICEKEDGQFGSLTCVYPASGDRRRTAEDIDRVLIGESSIREETNIASSAREAFNVELRDGRACNIERTPNRELRCGPIYE